jgi:Integrase zinc binding domain/Integrase core domain
LSPIVIEDKEKTKLSSLNKLFAQDYESDKFLKQVLKLVKNGTRHCKGISLSDYFIDEDGRLRFRGLLYVPENNMFRFRIMQLCHDSAIANYPGRAKTFALLRRNYYWPKDYSDVRKYVKFCQIYRRVKGVKHAFYGTLKSFSVPNERWKDISMDFIVALPFSNGHDAIFVVVDRLTKMKHLILCHITDNADKLAMLFITYVWKFHGLPKSIISDRGSLFKSEFWKRLCKRLGIDSLLSTAFHPETDGQTEIVNATLEAVFRCYVNHH